MNNCKKNKAILIGNGTMGKRHRAYFEACGIEFVETFDLEESDKKKFTEYLDERKNPDFVVIASPASTHYGYVKNCLNRGIPVFVEKPLATSAEQAQELVKLAKEKCTLLFVAQSECFNPLFLNFRKHFFKDAKIFFQECQSDQCIRLRFRREHKYSERCRDVNVAFDLLVHDLSLFLTMFRYDSLEMEYSRLSVNEDQAKLLLSITRGEYAGLQAEFYVNRNSDVDIRNVVAQFPDSEYVMSFAYYDKNGDVLHIPDSLENEHKFFLKLLAGACGDWGERLAQVSADAVKLAAQCKL